jgi:HlyD family secretion protein
MKKQFAFVTIITLILTSCRNNENDFDASGSFEAVETIISAEANGKILSLKLNEGDELNTGQIVGYIDSTQAVLMRDQLMQSQRAILSGRPQVKVQLEALQKELDNAIMDRNRIANLVKGDVASQKQLDDADARITTIKARIEAQKSSLESTSTSLTEQGSSVTAQLNLINDQLKKCRITNPVTGTVLTKYAEENEMTGIGKPVYKIADLRTMILRVFISGGQLPKIKIGQKVKVYTDSGDKNFKETTGTISWISSKAEFTPKTIQTKDERANLVYAVKLSVQNDGYYKIGMYGEIKF